MTWRESKGGGNTTAVMHSVDMMPINALITELHGKIDANVKAHGDVLINVEQRLDRVEGVHADLQRQMKADSALVVGKIEALSAPQDPGQVTYVPTVDKSLLPAIQELDHRVETCDINHAALVRDIQADGLATKKSLYENLEYARALENRIKEIANRPKPLQLVPKQPPKVWPIYLMLLIIAAAQIFLMTGCGKDHTVAQGTAFHDDQLDHTAALYAAQVGMVRDGDGFIEFTDCDSLLFSSLAAVGMGSPINLVAARQSDGRWQRRPLSYIPCYPDHSDTTISWDMLLGVMWYGWANHDLAMLESIWDYGHSRSWIMGDGARSIVTLIPQHVALLAQLIFKLGGADHEERRIPADFPKGFDSFQAHLLALEILLHRAAYDGLPASAPAAVSDLVSRHPDNPLFLCADGDYRGAADLLNSGAYWPHDRLPTSADRCEQWVPQRDGPWAPCDDGKTHSGGDLLFVWRLLSEGWCG